MADEDDRGTIRALERRLDVPYHQLYDEIARRVDLTGDAKVVYSILVSYYRRFDRVFPGQVRLAKDAGCSVRSIRRHLVRLQEARLLHVERRFLGQTNIYTLLEWPDITEAKMASPGGQDAPASRTGRPRIPLREKVKQKKREPGTPIEDLEQLRRDREKYGL
jgi:hypothetical protein